MMTMDHQRCLLPSKTILQICSWKGGCTERAFPFLMSITEEILALNFVD